MRKSSIAAAAFGCLLGCAPKVVPFEIPREPDAQTMIVGSLRSERLSVWAMEASSPITELEEATLFASDDDPLQVVVSYFDENLVELGLSAGPVAAASEEESFARPLRPGRKSLSTQIDGQSEAATWTEIDAFPEPLSSFRIAGTNVCRLDQSRQLSLDGFEKIVALLPVAEDRFIVVASVNDNGPSAHLLSVGLDGSVDTSSTVIARLMPTDAVLDPEGTIHVTGISTTSSTGEMWAGPVGGPFEKTRELREPLEALAQGASGVLYALGRYGTLYLFSATAAGPIASLGVAGEGGLIGVGLEDDLVLISAGGLGLFRYKRERLDKQRTPIDPDLSTPDEDGSLERFTGVGFRKDGRSLIGTLRGRVLKGEDSGWTVQGTTDAGRRILAFHSFEDGFVSAGMWGTLHEYYDDVGFCPGVVVAGGTHLSQLVKVGSSLVATGTHNFNVDQQRGRSLITILQR